MSYAIRNDGLGWRSVSGPQDVMADETYSEIEPVLVPTKSQRLAERNAQYASDMSALQSQWLAAAVEDGDAEVDRKTDVEADIADTKSQYLADLAAIRNS